ncbi:sulfite exporter TauE/SafE family protein [Thiocystis violacea]|uniref:sulfite exporter TauE/SafE family protein n=1 Tax=Thiocystis violacea TaxID=13725 RepID=UPI001904FB0D|nr:sulfite exporter TauE/SafE family protein [Thiocystis violacea]MBK1717160.1 hypothetical protein [Thiocystis violacea]
MSRQPPGTDESIARQFRSCVFKPAEGVFLFHPRALERLVSEHLEPQGYAGSIPDLAYYVMSRADFLSGLESENPEALAVIEGLSLPDYVILLPMPLELRLDHAGFTRLLRDYWARRFEGEIARAWWMARDLNEDGGGFGPKRLRELIGETGMAEVRDVLTRDGVMPAGLDDAQVCRAFVALVSRLRYFSPGARGYFFPAIRDWPTLDAWLTESGLDLPPPKPASRLPCLLERSRPEARCGHPTRYPLLPSGLPYGLSDPDLDSVQRSASIQPSAARAGEPETFLLEALDLDELPPTDTRAPEARCLAALRRGLQLPRQDWRSHLKDRLLDVVAPILEPLLELPNRLRRRSRSPQPARGVRLELYLRLFGHAVRRAQRTESTDHYAATIRHLATAERRFEAMGEPCAPEAEQVRRILEQRRHGAGEALAGLLAAKWKMSSDAGRELGILVGRLGEDLLDRRRASRGLLRDLERVLMESRTTYYQLRPIAWLLSAGRTRLRQILPFQANLKALRALDMAQNRLDRLGWPAPEAERSRQPLQALSRRLTDHLEGQLKPHLQRALREAGFTPGSHREEVAFNKLLRELLDVIEHRRHLRFTDMRDIVARNLMRLPDLSVDELFRGDRLARFDSRAARALPGVYRPGEIYIKGLQKLGAPLFGTPQGRLLLRHLILPLGLAFIGLKTLDVIVGLLASVEPSVHLTNPWLLVGLALLINAVAYTSAGRIGARAFLRALWWSLRLLLFDGMRRLMRWRPVSRLLESEIVRGLDRNLLRPFVIGLLLMLPIVGAASLIEGAWVRPNLSLVALTLVLGILVRNTPGGRRVLDDIASAVGAFVRRLNQTLVLGLIQELMIFFKEVTRRFQQGLHRIEERLSHHLGESAPQLLLKALLVPVWRFLESIIQFYATVLVEPQVNPIKHFPLVTIAHKLMLPFLPLITSLMVEVLDPVLPKWIAIPFVTLTMLLLPGLAGFLVWELKENWKIYAANHSALNPAVGARPGLYAVRREDLAHVPIEPAIIGSHGETLRGFLKRGFHSGTLPKAFDRLRRVLRQQIANEVENPQRLRDAQRHLAEIEQAICVFCDRELAYALRRRCKDPDCALSWIQTRRPRLASASFELMMELRMKKTEESEPPIELCLSIWLQEPDLYLNAEIRGNRAALGEICRDRIREDIRVFSGRAGATHVCIDLG